MSFTENEADISKYAYKKRIFSSTCLGILLLLFVILNYFSLIQIYGRWYLTDEYVIFSRYDKDGFSAFEDRIAHWSPRFFSETLFYLYYQATAISHAQLITLFLILCWTSVTVALFAGVFQYTKKGAALTKIFLSLALLADFLMVGHKGYELFFWPAAAVAYLPTLAAAAFLLFPVSSAPKILFTSPLVVGVLVIAGTSSEIGTLFVLSFSFLILGWALSIERMRFNFKQLLYWFIPVAFAATVMLIIAYNRLGKVEYVLTTAQTRNMNPAQLHNMIMNLWSGLKYLAVDLMVPNDYTWQWLSGSEHFSTIFIAFIIATAVAAKILYFMGFRGCWKLVNAEYRSTPHVLLYALALLATCYFSIALAYYQYGDICCQRHDALRQCFYVLIIAALAIWSAGRSAGADAPKSIMPASFISLAVLLQFFL